jgi:hypothetical protein
MVQGLLRLRTTPQFGVVASPLLLLAATVATVCPCNHHMTLTVDSVRLPQAVAFGHLNSDSQYSNLYHVTAADPHSTFAFDFEFADTTTFDTEGDEGVRCGRDKRLCVVSRCARARSLRESRWRLHIVGGSKAVVRRRSDCAWTRRALKWRQRPRRYTSRPTSMWCVTLQLC